MSETDFSNLPYWLPRQVRKIGLTLEQVAHRIGVSRTMMYEYLQDTARPSEQTMLKMCRLFKVPFEEGLSQYTPKTNGRPRGSGTKQELKVRKR